jgi:(4-O-methyl)-D-glucuronate---lignin esterase
MDMYKIINLSSISRVIFFFGCANAAIAQNPDQWKEDFKDPPASAHPRTWWHWTQSNITKEGITKDLEWMKRAGIAGFMLADVSPGQGQEVQQKLVYGTPEWREALHFASEEAERLDLEMAVFSSPGWSLTGGPWVQPEEAMKKLVWSETKLRGKALFNDKLLQPPTQQGAGPNLADTPSKPGEPHFYRDCAVIAFRTPDDEAVAESAVPLVTTVSGKFEGDVLTDQNLQTGIVVKTDNLSKIAWLQLQYDLPVLARSITIGSSRGIPFGRVLASHDGRKFYTLVALPGKSGYRGGKIRTYTFPETQARYYRIELTNEPARPADVISQATTNMDSVYTLDEVWLHSGGRVNRWEDKAGFNFLFEYSGVATPVVPPSALVSSEDIFNLTSKMRSDGTLKWEVPAGNWTILRFGYALTGARNRPTIPAASGYEVDKMNRKYVESYMKNYTELLRSATGSLYGKRLRYVLMDSWEAGIQNWTDNIIEEFKKCRGYDLTHYLPVLAGRIVGGAEESDRFLWDFRRTLVDLIAEEHYGTITDYLHKQGLKTYAEAGGVSLESIEDALLNKKYVDIPMGEFWVKDLHPSSMYFEDVRGAASASHVYGKGLTAAESFTGGNYESPARLKEIADYWFSQGVNRIVFHTSAHQPLDTKPGNTMVGTHINRNITWAENAAPFIDYLSRCSYMLQKGTYVADIAFMLNEGGPSTMPFWGAGLQPSPPRGYEFDYINDDVLLNFMSVDTNGTLTLPSGMNYAVLVLPLSNQMSLPALRKIKQLVEDGATVVGPKPLSTPSLADGLEGNTELEEMAFALWGDLDGKSRTTRAFGKGRIFWGMPLEDVLAAIKVPRDITINCLPEDVAWTHRKDDDTDIYYVVNRTNTAQDLSLTLRAANKDVTLWNPDDASISPATYALKGNFMTVPVHLEGKENMFLVLSGVAPAASRNVPAKDITTLDTIVGQWQVTFQTELGGPSKVEFDSLESWTDRENDGIKYFSGTATYHKTINIEPSRIQPGANIWLDLGKVGDMAEVWLNGKKVGLAWHPPYRVDISKALKGGSNTFEIKVTNEWTNRLIGDKLNPDKKVLDSYIRPFGGSYELSESGLMGPVTLLSVN